MAFVKVICLQPCQALNWTSNDEPLLFSYYFSHSSSNTYLQFIYFFRYNYYMGFFSVTFLLLSYQLTRFFGPVGFILANCTNLASRIIFSSRYIRKQYYSVDLKPLDGIKPKKLFAITLVVAGILCKFSEVQIDFYIFVDFFRYLNICFFI